MAKRKRLSPAAIADAPPLPAGLETKAHNGWAGYRSPGARAPIAEVSGDAAAQSAFEEVAEELHAARAEGRMVLALPLDAVEAGHLVRDRLSVDAAEMAALKDSLRARGQQTPVQVEDLGRGRYGLISGWRRLMALRALAAEPEEGAEARFATVQALVRRPGDAADAYRAMVEENEIRADLSFYERARIAVKAVEQGIHPDVKTAVQSLFAATRAPKRSKIAAFTALVEAFDAELRFPAAIPERLGLALSAAVQAEASFVTRLREALRTADPADAAAERKVLDATLRKRQARPPAASTEVAPGVTLQGRAGHATLSGTGVDARLLSDLRDWLANRGR